MPDDPEVSGLSSNLAAVNVSGQRPPVLQFGNYNPADMDPQLSMEAISASLQASKAKLQEQITDIQNSEAEQRQDAADMRDSLDKLSAGFEEFRQLMRSALPQLPRAAGPTDKELVAELLNTKQSRKKAVEDFGWGWALDMEQKNLIPLPAYQDRDFRQELMSQQAKAASGMPIPPAVPASNQSAGLLASANLAPVSPAAVSKAASDALPALTTNSPFSAALAGKHIKFEMPKPSKFSRIAADSDIRAWLVRIHEYLTITGVDPSVWVVFAGSYLDKSPLNLWESRKAQLALQPDVLYSWESFKEWCIKSFSVHNHEMHAISQLEALTQTGSVANYKADHNVLAAKLNLPMQLRIYWWQKGLKEHIRAQVKVDPETHQEYTDIDKAQSAACALDAHIDASSAAAASKKRPPSTASASVRSDSRRPTQRPRFTDYVDKGPARVVQWQGNSPDEFECPDKNGRLAEPLPSFFMAWYAGLPSPSNGSHKKFLPKDLLVTGPLRPNTCYYKGCAKPGHSWDHCPRLALHIAKNPAVRNA